MRLYRILVINYVITFTLVAAANLPPVMNKINEVQLTWPFTRVLFGLMAGVAAVTFFILFIHSLYHWGTHTPVHFNKVKWFLIIVVLNFVGVLVYYLRVIAPEQKLQSKQA
jgi:hypothetical protein